MAWRYGAASGNGSLNTNAGNVFAFGSGHGNVSTSTVAGSGIFSHTPTVIFSAGEFLRNNATSGIEPKQQGENEEEEEEVSNNEVGSYQQGSSTTIEHSSHVANSIMETSHAQSVFGRVRTSMKSLGGAFLRNITARGGHSDTTTGPVNGVDGSSINRTAWGRGLENLQPQRLFDRPAPPTDSVEYEDGYDEEEDGEDGDREFLRNTKALFAEIDQELLSDVFVPYEHVLQIISSDDGTEATASDIDERLIPYHELQEELDELLGKYIEAHHDEFNEAISGFSELILAVSGSDEMLARLKQQLIMATASLQSRAEQLQVLRIRAAKALLMTESLKGLEESLSCESAVKQLISTHHYLAAVRMLKKHRERLEMSEFTDIRATQALRDYVNGTLETLHTTIIDDLMSTVFRQGKLNEADAQLVDRMLADGASEGSSAAMDALGEQSGGKHLQGSSMDKSAVTFSSVVGDIHDDPSDEDILHNYLRFIPLCVRALQELDKLDRCYGAFFSCATGNIEQTIAHFLRLYGVWRRRALSFNSVAGTADGATVRAIRVQGKERASNIISSDEAAAMIQAPELRAMLNALFTEMEKIVRNADYLIRVILTAYFPFLAPLVFKSGGFNPEQTYESWDILHAPIRDMKDFHEIVISAFSTALSMREGLQRQAVEESVESIGGENTDVVSLKRLMVKFDVNSTFEKLKLSGRSVCFQDIRNAIDVAGEAVRRDFPEEGEELAACCAEVDSLILISLLQSFRHSVKEMYEQWDVYVLTSQFGYYMELIFHVLCDAKEVEEDTSDEMALKAFLKHRNLVRRVQRTAEMMSGGNVDTFSSLEKMLSAQDSSGILTVMEQAGRVSFSLVAAVKSAQRDLRRLNEGRRQHSRGDSVVAITGGNISTNSSDSRSGALILKQAGALKNLFVLTPMNLLTCYECTRRFFQRCNERAPRLSNAFRNELKEFLRHFLQTTYVPTVYMFYAQQLRQLCAEVSEGDGFTSETAANGESDKTSLPLSSAQPAPIEPLVHHQKGEPVGIKWPTVYVGRNNVTTGIGKGATTSNNKNNGSGNGNGGSSSSSSNNGSHSYPILACVYYVGQVLHKVSRICRVFPDSLAEEVQQNIAETLLTELTVFFKKKCHLITQGSLQHRLLFADFEDAFFDHPTARWNTLSDEARIQDAHNAVDTDIFQYYAYNNEQRTSGHQYISVKQGNEGELVGGASRDKTRGGGNRGNLEPSIGSASAADLALKGDGVVVALAVLCHSMEWLCDVTLCTLAPDEWYLEDNTKSLVPGTVFLRQYARWSGSSAAVAASSVRTATGETSRWTHLGGILKQMYCLSRVCLFALSIEARFAAFQFIPQLRDESYNLVATSSFADTFVQAYNRRITNFFALLKMHLSENKLKYVGITIAKPLSDLLMVELSHLRDKYISSPGLTRLRVNLLSMETALLLLLPVDDEVREAVKQYLKRPATFLRYLLNKDVTSDLITSGDFKYFSVQEMEELLRLVFCQEKNHEIVSRQIELLHEKLRSGVSTLAAPQRPAFSQAIALPQSSSLTSVPTTTGKREEKPQEQKVHEEEEKMGDGDDNDDDGAGKIAPWNAEKEGPRYVDPNGSLTSSRVPAPQGALQREMGVPVLLRSANESDEEEEEEEEEEEYEEEEYEGGEEEEGDDGEVGIFLRRRHSRE